jgi:hypothetical protein
MKLPDPTAAAAASLFRLWEAILDADPALNELVGRREVRISFDTRERLLLISVLDQQGRGTAVAAVQADPFDAAFGTVGWPEPVCGTCGAPEETKH